MRHETQTVRPRHHAQAPVFSSRRCQSQPDCRHVRVLQSFGETILMPAHKGVTPAELVEQARRLQHDVWSNELFHAIEYERVRAQVPGPTKVEMRSIETSDMAAERRTRLVDFGAKVAHLVLRENRDRLEEAKFLVISYFFLRQR